MPTYYKYRSWDNNWNRTILTSGEVFFANLNSFNDPFDEGIPYQIQDLSPEEFAEIQVKHMKGWQPGITEEQELQVRNDALAMVEDKTQEELEELSVSMKEKLQENNGVLCLSKNSDNILMWSHYADAHKGFCVGIDSKFLELPQTKVYLVECTKEYPRLTSIDESKEIYRKSVAVKFADWEYEEEIRVIRNKFVNKSERLPPEAFTEVLFGLRTTKQSMKEIILVARNLNPRIKFYQQEKKPGHFKVKPRLLNDAEVNEIVNQ